MWRQSCVGKTTLGLLRYLYRSGLVCSRGYWSCDLLTGLPILQTHRLGLACSRDYWSCSPRPLTELPVLQTHVLVLPVQGFTGLAACSQDYLSCSSQARSCLLKGLLVLQPSAAHRFTCLVNSRCGLAAQGITGLATLKLAHRFTYLAKLGSLLAHQQCSRRPGFRLCVSNLDRSQSRVTSSCRVGPALVHEFIASLVS
jgi:hypothetical protein